MLKKLELSMLEMCEKLLPKTSERSNPDIKKLLAEIRKELGSK